jgi:hypothetical protein
MDYRNGYLERFKACKCKINDRSKGSVRKLFDSTNKSSLKFMGEGLFKERTMERWFMLRLCERIDELEKEVKKMHRKERTNK